MTIQKAIQQLKELLDHGYNVQGIKLSLKEDDLLLTPAMLESMQWEIRFNDVKKEDRQENLTK